MNIDVWKMLKNYKSSSKCGYQQHYMVVLEEDMVSTSEGLTDKCSMDVGTSENTNNKTSRKYLNKFS